MLPKVPPTSNALKQSTHGNLPSRTTANRSHCRLWQDRANRSLERPGATDFSVAWLYRLMLYNQAPQTGRGAGVAERGCLLSSCTG
jgi:hypothetical protein